MTARSAIAIQSSAFAVPLAGVRKALEDFDRSQARCRSLMRRLGWIAAASDSGGSAPSERWER